ncbi:stalk domain-containing protein [Desulforudis sp. 1088]|uniref:stalk domain-containing protein n=1 Tax=Desulforudis sp. 1088 TaxID=3416137 RepID=UPI003CEE08F2
MAVALFFCVFTIAASAACGAALLKPGDSGSDVFALQQQLRQLGYLNATPNGYYGPKTTAAVAQLQKDYNLAANGVADLRTNQLINRLLTSAKTTRKEVLGFYVCDEPRIPSSFGTLAAQKDKITSIAPFWYRLDSNNPTKLEIQGNATREEIDRVIRFCKDNNIKNYALVHNLLYNSSTTGKDVVRTALSDPQKRWALVMNIFNLLKSKGFDGVCIDIENIYSADRDLYNQFLAELSAQLKPAGYAIIVCVPPKVSDSRSGGWGDNFDYAKVGKYADMVAVMAYDEHTTVTGAGPIASQGFVEKVVKYTLSKLPAEKVLLGIPGYSFDWNLDRGGATYLSHELAMATARRYNRSVQWDERNHAPYFEYADRSGSSHTVYFENAGSLAGKLDLVNRYNLRGIALWRLGMEDPGTWELIARKFQPHAITITVNGKSVNSDAACYVDRNNRTMVPLRFIAEALGAQVQWDAAKGCVTVTRGNDTIQLWLGTKGYRLNNGYHEMDTIPVVKDGRTMVPLRFIAEAFGAKVDWDGKAKKIAVTL